MNAPDELTAVHEASHCVVRNHFGMEVDGLWINEEGGNCRFRVPDHGDIVLFEDIAGSLAGKVGEDRLRGYTNDEEWLGSWDYKRAMDCALRLNAGDTKGAELLLTWMERRTELFVAKLWPQIQKVAYALLDKEKLSGREIEQILEAHRDEHRSET